MFAARAARQSALCGAVLSAAASAATPAPQATAVAPPPATYVIKPGDTLVGLAERAFVDPDDWRPVARLNKIDDPARLPAGKTLVIPSKLLRREPFDARIAAWSGQVRTIPDKPVAVGGTVGAGTIVETGPNSFLTLQLADGSRVTLPSQSRLRIDRLDRVALDGHVDRGFTVLAGRGDFSVPRRERQADRFLVKTPVAVAAVRGTKFRVEHRETASTITVVEGDVTSRGLAARGEAGVGQGQGAVVGTKASRMARMLPPPKLENPGRVQDEPEVLLEVPPLGARRHVVLARDAGFVDRFAEAETTDAVIRIGDVPNGELYARLSAIDSDGIEGLPADYELDRYQTGLDADAAALPRRPRQTRFAWRARGAGTPAYDFVLARDAALGDRVVDAPGLAATELTVTGLAPGEWFWQVSVLMQDGQKTRVRRLPVRKLTIAARDS